VREKELLVWANRMVVGELIGEEKLAVGRLDAGSERSNEWTEHVLVGVEDLKLKLKWKLDWTRCLVDKGYERQISGVRDREAIMIPKLFGRTRSRDRNADWGADLGLTERGIGAQQLFASDLNGSNLRFYLRSVRANDMSTIDWGFRSAIVLQVPYLEVQSRHFSCCIPDVSSLVFLWLLAFDSCRSKVYYSWT
jgi:hypothetical protein